MTVPHLLLGIDGGGSRTRAWLATQLGDSPAKVIGKGTASASNPRSTSWDEATAQLTASVDASFIDAGVRRQSVRSACLCMAGADRDDERSWIEQWADETGLAERVTVTNDALPLLFAQGGDGVGVALISGTGSLAFGRADDGRVARAGGWGPLLGDEGSGFQIAVEALHAATRAADRCGPATDLLPQLLNHFQIDQPTELIARVYDANFGRKETAALSPIVFAAAESGDNEAKKIIDRAAEALARMVAAVAERLRFDSGQLRLCVTGGVLLHQVEFVNLVRQQLVRLDRPPSELQAVADAAIGAVAIAAAPDAAHCRR